MQVHSYDVDQIIVKLTSEFPSFFLANSQFKVPLEFRHHFSTEKIDNIPNNPIITYRLKKTEPAAYKGKPFSEEKDYALRDYETVLNKEGILCSTMRMYLENLVEFAFYSHDYFVVRDLAKWFSNYVIGLRQYIRKALQIPELLFWARGEERSLNVSGTLLYFTTVDIYLKTITILEEDENVIVEILQHIEHSDT